MKTFKKIRETQIEQFNLIMDVVCQHYSTTREQITDRSRRTETLKPRQMFVYMAYLMIDRITQKEIVQFLEGTKFDRSMVSVIFRNMNGWMKTDKALEHEVKEVNEKIYAESKFEPEYYQILS